MIDHPEWLQQLSKELQAFLFKIRAKYKKSFAIATDEFTSTETPEVLIENGWNWYQYEPTEIAINKLSAPLKKELKAYISQLFLQYDDDNEMIMNYFRTMYKEVGEDFFKEAKKPQ